jgi:hypothetical protein
MQLKAATQRLTSRCEQGRNTDRRETEILVDKLSREAQLALGSESQLMLFLINPSTKYLDRMAAASYGAALISPEQLPTLWKASADLRKLAEGGWYGEIPHVVDTPPCYYLMTDNLGPEDWVMRLERRRTSHGSASSVEIFGQNVQLTGEAVDYPVTMDERKNAPWAWQISRALAVLMNGVATRYASAELYPKLVDAAWRWEPSNSFESAVREEAVRRGPGTPFWIETMMRLALEEPDKGVAAMVPLDLWNYGRYSTDHLNELREAALVGILRKSTDGRVAGAAFRLLTQPRTNTAILEASRRAMDGKLDLLTRYYVFAVPVCKAAGRPPFTCDKTVQPGSPEVVDALKKLEDWFVQQHDTLERNAMLERAQLNSLLADLHANFG